MDPTVSVISTLLLIPMPPADTPVTGIRLVRVNKLALKVAWIYVTFYAIRQPFTMQVIPALECALLVPLVGLTSY